ncbi:hypothetical protein CALVIDRAFT_537507 [Calocera viscosa TUFC12733]|uniref:Uncharacterized protein n=1 Tax=Calocera viscosa (strain TUFC12733) TaxID=1330018 RepID=A0A167LPW5_CALVF|nr:hypothetical protein CALVIDRAFT_537507 [Calocera viscosa TUFC12733]
MRSTVPLSIINRPIMPEIDEDKVALFMEDMEVRCVAVHRSHASFSHSSPNPIHPHLMRGASCRPTCLEPIFADRMLTVAHRQGTTSRL